MAGEDRITIRPLQPNDEEPHMPRTARHRAMSAAALIAFGLAALLAGGCFYVSDPDVTIVNDSGHVLVELRLAFSTEDEWGANLLGPEGLAPGESATVGHIDDGLYDLRLLDGSGLQCSIYDYELDVADNRWIIDDSLFNRC